MRVKVLSLLTYCLIASQVFAHSNTETIHVFVALCDNQNQGIVPVPASLGNGQDPKSNLYWGAAYGVKSFLRYKATDWVYQKQLPSPKPMILERILFKHATKNVYLLADAYDGANIKNCIEDFLLASNGQNPETALHGKTLLKFGGNSNLIAYCGHNGLMEFSVDLKYVQPKSKKEVIILACYSKEYFQKELKANQSEPLVWTTHLMAPETYTLKAAIDGWLNNETNLQIEERAAQAYHKYQKCGIKGARQLITTGF